MARVMIAVLEWLLVAGAGAWAGWLVAGLVFLACRTAGVQFTARATATMFAGLGLLGAVALLGARNRRAG